jgi:RimJ/RimL family protein N-acetyltransferase
MPIVCLHDKKAIERFLRENIYLHIYSIGDLDDFFWPHTIWYALKSDAAIEAAALVYLGQSLPTLLALCTEPDSMRELLQAVEHVLPRRFYAHLSPGLEQVFRNTYEIEDHGEHHKMALRDGTTATGWDCPGVQLLSQADLDDILQLYKDSYPGNWFDPRMLATKQYFGIRTEGELVSIGGVHVYSARYRVAALGNIATRPSHKNRGYAKRVTARLCQSLSERVDHIGLNVKADNDAAISCYKKLGFEVVACYGEFTLELK